MEDLLSMMPSSVDMEPVPDLHISLSRTVTLQYQWIDPFVDSIRQRLASFGGFTYCFDNVEFYANDEKTRLVLNFLFEGVHLFKGALL